MGVIKIDLTLHCTSADTALLRQALLGYIHTSGLDCRKEQAKELYDLIYEQEKSQRRDFEKRNMERVRK